MAKAKQQPQGVTMADAAALTGAPKPAPAPKPKPFLSEGMRNDLEAEPTTHPCESTAPVAMASPTQALRLP